MLIEDPEQASTELALAQSEPAMVVGIYLADMERGPDGTPNRSFREAFRATGPSNYAHGKQAGLR